MLSRQPVTIEIRRNLSLCAFLKQENRDTTTYVLMELVILFYYSKDPRSTKRESIHYSLNTIMSTDIVESNDWR